MLFYTIFLASKTYLQAHGKTRPIVIAAIVGNLVNYVACTLLVRWYGALGSGMAMSISAGVLAGIGLFAAWRTGEREGLPKAPSAVRIIRLGVPIAATLVAEIGVFVFASVLAGRLGPAVTSAHQVAMGLASFTFMGALGVSGATAVRVGRAVGEGVSVRSRGWLGIGLGGAVMLLGTILFAVIPRQLASLFSPEPDVIEIGASLLRIAAVFQLFDGVQCVAGGALRGAGDLKFAFVAGAFGYWAVGFPIAVLLGFGLGWGAPGIWWGLTLGLVTVAVILTARFHRLSGKVIARIA
jgi:MATE family multidrug resistance protein